MRFALELQNLQKTGRMQLEKKANLKHFGMSLLAEATDEGQASAGYVNVDVQ